MFFWQQGNNPVPVLLYHRVADLKRDPQQIAVSTANFAAHMQLIRRKYNVLSLYELLDGLSRHKLPRNTVVITFDDGYADNLINALPVLEKYKIPATMFITSGMVGQDKEFWWDYLEQIFFTSNILGKHLKVESSYQNIDVEVTTAEIAQQVHDQITALFKHVNVEERNQIVQQLISFANIEPKARASHRTLTKLELKQLSESKYITIGSHTVDHPVLKLEAPGSQQYQLQLSRETLQQITGKEIGIISYPYGSIDDFDDVTIEIARKYYTAGIANIQEACRPDTDGFRVPRKLVRNWEIDEFAAQLESFFG
jgi:peptidoglycan/xylan/chitin deacetylase (PgdA/CDA1 family)